MSEMLSAAQKILALEERAEVAERLLQQIGDLADAHPGALADAIRALVVHTFMVRSGILSDDH